MGRQAIVLAAGKGTRMESDLPKVLVTACGRPLIRWVLEALRKVDVDQIAVVVGYCGEDVEKELTAVPNLEFVEQEKQLGTGHAVMVCQDWLAKRDGFTLIVAGDSPLIQPDSIDSLFREAERTGAACVLGTLEKPDPSGLGRVVRNANGEFEAIVEDKDASETQKAIREVNMSTYVFATRELEHALGKLTNDNKQREYYLTDCPGILKDEGKEVRAARVLKDCESFSVNTMEELKLVEDEMRRLGYGGCG